MEDNLMVHKILVVDDNDLTLESIIQAIRKRTGNIGYGARDGNEAIEILKNNPIDLVITDVHMPKVGGKELLSSIKETHRDVPVIVMSGYANADDVRHFLKQGAFDYLMKPVSIKELVDCVNSALRAKLSAAQGFPPYNEKPQVLNIGTQKYSDEHNMILGKKGYDLHFAQNDETAFEIMSQNRIGVVVWQSVSQDSKKFLDILKMIKETYPFTRNIICGSGLENKRELELISEIMKLGFDYIAKDNYAELPEAIEAESNKRIAEINKVLFRKGAEPNKWAFAAPHGGGKTKTINAVVAALACTYKVRRHTSRKPRSYEIDGEDHYFVDDEYFQRHKNDFIYMFKHQGSQGPPYWVGFEKGVIEEKLRQGLDVLLTFTDPESFKAMKEHYPDMKSIYIQADPRTLHNGSVERDGIIRSTSDVEKEYDSFKELEIDLEFDFVVPRRTRATEDDFPMMTEIPYRVKVISSIIQGRRLEKIIRSEIKE